MTTPERLALPDPPAAQSGLAVKGWRADVTIPTYRPAAPDRNPMFLETRVYQGSSGRVYPLPYYDRISDTPVAEAWDAVHLDNGLVRVMVLPQLGGRIHVGLDLTNGYDFFYRQNVLKPALVGLAGPWCSGGVEFNWPQHHRPATYMPVEVAIERHADGAVTVWCSDHEPMTRMKGMHGVRLRPGSSAVEVHARLHNRTNDTQTFLWWANLATRVHDRYQSFFPTDVTHVADHARRAMSTFPLADGNYYGVDYGARARAQTRTQTALVAAADAATDELVAANDLRWYRNIPVPTSYMILGTEQDFFGGYDHAAAAGVVHVADRHIAPGKKQWTWGDHPFGHAWDRNLTDGDGPYIELMAGVFTDNQPDFSFLMPGETRTFSQCWYPLQQIGIAHAANRQAALHLSVTGGAARCGVCVPAALRAVVVLTGGMSGRKSTVLARWERDLRPGVPLVETLVLPRGLRPTDVRLSVLVDGREVLAHQPPIPVTRPAPPPATEPPAPEHITSADELYLTGLHLAQYRHATRSPLPYWHAALARDAGDSRCNTALGRWHLRRGETTTAETHLRAAVGRLTQRNGNPADGEAHYLLGLCLRARGVPEAAQAALAKACWNQAWQAAGHLALAEIEANRGADAAALEQVELSLRRDADGLHARALRVLLLRRLGRDDEAQAVLVDTRRLDPLDLASRFLAGAELGDDAQMRLDLALDLARAGFRIEALAVLAKARAGACDGAGPLLRYHRARLLAELGRAAEAAVELTRAAAEPPDWCFPARLEDLSVLDWALVRRPTDARAHHYRGNWLYDRRRHREALRAWGYATKHDPTYSVSWRNLGLGTYNVLSQPGKARAAYQRAIACAPADARLWFERDQLWKRTGVTPQRRLAALALHAELVASRDDLSVEVAHLLCQVGRFTDAEALIDDRRCQPWEGGEGQALAAYRRIQLARGRQALVRGEAAEAKRRFAAILAPPAALGETWHLLQNLSDVWCALGEACAALGERDAAREWWRKAAEFRGDFQGMRVQAYSECTLHSARALERLGRRATARTLLHGLARHARALAKAPATIDYFATSLPSMLLFTDDLTARQQTTARFLLAQAELGLGQTAAARRLLAQVLARDPNHTLAQDLLTELAQKPPRTAGARSSLGSASPIAPRPRLARRR